MSTSLAGAAPKLAVPHIDQLKIAIVRAEWNGHITQALTDGAIEVLTANGYPASSAEVWEVPGAVELTYAAKRLMDSGRYDAIIMFGCVIRGGTPHFDYVCQSVTSGMTQLNLQGQVPVLFGVLTVDSEQDALDRAGGRLGNKGAEAAEAALLMVANYNDL